MTRAWKVWLARRRLQRLVEANAISYEVLRYRERRAAALKGARREVAR